MAQTEGNGGRLPKGEDPPTTVRFGGATVGPGCRIGPYKLLSILGEGGFAVVYLAQQTDPVKRRVALKIIKAGMDSKQVIARFAAERQALALLDHPNIAHILDAGTTDFGRPYFVMDCAKGVSLTEHCTRHRLTTEQRLELFLHVCDAVQHAHHKGIIHRDIKPSNIQVCTENDRFVLKVIDFGVAKALSQPLTDRTLVTERGQMIGTPEYMSPEQAEMISEDIDTRTDVYSLGVVLYELLTGTLPFDSEALRKGGIESLRRTICEESPQRPSARVGSLVTDQAAELARSCQADAASLRRRLRGDLDSIVLKAMEKDRTRRYPTVHALAEDIRRHLCHEPLLARPPSMTYRLRKYLRKHQARLLRAAVVILFVTMVGIVAVELLNRRRSQKQDESRQHEQILSEARGLCWKGQFQEALDKNREILDSQYVGPQARLLWARLLLETHGPADARAALEHLLEERPQAEIACPAHFLMAKTYRESHPPDPQTVKEYRQHANRHQKEGERLFSGTVEAHFNRAMIAGTLEEAIEDLNLVLELNDKHYEALKWRALAYHALRRYAEMADDAVLMTHLEKADPLGYSLRAAAQCKAGNFARAIEFHNEAIALAPHNAELHSQRYETYFGWGKYRHALKDAQECVRADPNELVYHFNVFAALVSCEEYERAKQKYDAIVGLDAAKQSEFKAWTKRYVFKVLGAKLPFHLPPEMVQDEPFSTMQKAAEYYHSLKSKADRLVSGVYGQSSWSPDSRELAFGRSDLYTWQPKILAAESLALSYSGGIEILDVESGTARTLVSFGKDPAWSPDGRYIAFVREPYRVREYKEEIWIVAAQGGEPRSLARGGWPMWAPDSDRLYFHSRVDSALYCISIDPPGEPEHVMECPGRFPWISPDERYVAYGVGSQLRIVEISSGREVMNWTAPDESLGLLVRWKPDGKELSVAGLTGSDLGLWILDVSTGKGWQIFDPPAISGIWSPDKKRMVVEVKVPYEENWLVALDPNVPTYEALRYALSREQYLCKRQQRYIREIADSLERGDLAETPEYLEQLTLVGRDLYRSGAPRDVLATFTRLDEFRRALHGTRSPVDVAFITMAWHGLGQKDKAQTALTELRGLFEGGQYRYEEPYLRQAEQLLLASDGSLYQIWEHIGAGELDKASDLVSQLRRSGAGTNTQDESRLRSAVHALARAYHDRGRRARHRGGGYEKTISDYEAAIRLCPGYAPALVDLGWLRAACPHEACRNRDEATKHAWTACEMTGWEDHRYLSALAAVFAEVGGFTSATKWQEESIKRLPPAERPKWGADYQMRLALYRSRMSYDKGNLWSFSGGKMVAWWTLDERSGTSAAEISGNDAKGILHGNCRWRPSDGALGGAVELDGDGDYVEVQNQAIFDFSEEVTVAAWVNITTVPTGWTPIVTKGNSAWRLSTCGAERRFHFAIGRIGSGLDYVDGNTEATVNEWHHVCGTYDGRTIRLYLDGAEDANQPYEGRMTSNRFTVCMGGNSEKVGRYWHGMIDDVRIYSYALSREEVRDLFDKAGEPVP